MSIIVVGDRAETRRIARRQHGRFQRQRVSVVRLRHSPQRAGDDVRTKRTPVGAWCVLALLCVGVAVAFTLAILATRNATIGKPNTPTAAKVPSESPSARKDDRAKDKATKTGKTGVPPKEKNGTDGTSKDEPIPSPIVPGQVLTVVGRATGYAPVIDDVLAALAGQPGTGEVIVTLAIGHNRNGTPIEAFCHFKSDPGYLLISRAINQHERLVVRGATWVLISGALSMKDCQLLNGP